MHRKERENPSNLENLHILKEQKLLKKKSIMTQLSAQLLQFPIVLEPNHGTLKYLSVEKPFN
jgi:hypothetical protein